MDLTIFLMILIRYHKYECFLIYIWSKLSMIVFQKVRTRVKNETEGVGSNSNSLTILVLEVILEFV
jgi:hypothetical protein